MLSVAWWRDTVGIEGGIDVSQVQRNAVGYCLMSAIAYCRR